MRGVEGRVRGRGEGTGTLLARGVNRGEGREGGEGRVEEQIAAQQSISRGGGGGGGAQYSNRV